MEMHAPPALYNLPVPAHPAVASSWESDPHHAPAARGETRPLAQAGADEHTHAGVDSEEEEEDQDDGKGDGEDKHKEATDESKTQPCRPHRRDD